MSAYYNEFDPKAAATLRELIREGLIAPGDVDERSIEDVLPSELTGYTQVHLFAGFGIWSLAFRMAGWPDSRPVWSASCPCQPFSAAGKGGGFADERHLWPAAFWLLQHGKQSGVPIYGEQVASPDGLAWLDLVRADLETVSHFCWSTVLASAGFGAPIIRQRSYWMACSNSEQYDGCGESGERRRFANSNRRSLGRMEWPASDGRLEWWPESGERCATSGCSTLRLDSSVQPGLEGYAGNGDGASGRQESIGSTATAGEPCGVAGASGDGCDRAHSITSEHGTERENGGIPIGSNSSSRMAGTDKWRPVEPGTFPLAHGYPERVGILRGAGNAISPQVAAAWVEVTM